ncbi:inactive ubiquitin carboxyl-terminal hydrolase MINDY-4B-like [Oculina patagonica]
MSKNSEDGINMLDRWAKVFDKSLATPVPKTLALKRSNTLELEDVQEDVSDDIDMDANRVFTLPTTPSNKASSHVCPRHGRERRKVLDEKPVKPARSIQPKPVKPVRQVSGKLVTLDNKSLLSKTEQEKSVAQSKNKPETLPAEKLTSPQQEVVKKQSTDIGPLLSHVTPARSKRQNSSSRRKSLEREQTAEPVKPAVPGGEPITLDVARALRVLLFGTPYTTFNSDWRKQHINFFSNMSYALSFYKLGPGGIMACLQGFLLRHLLYDQPSIEQVKSMLTPMSSDRQKALITAMAKMLWQAGGHKHATVALPCGECNWITMEDYREDQLTEKLHLFRFTNFVDLERFLKKQLSFFESTNGNGCILLLYSIILSRTIERVIEDLGDPNSTLMGPHDSCTQAMINLMLTGRAAANVFNGDIECNKSGRKLAHPLNGIKDRSEIGFLSLEEHLDPKSFQVGSMLKTPKFPVWVVKTGERYGVLFSLNKDLVNDWKLERRFDLLFCTGSAKRNSAADECVLTIDTRDVFNPNDEFGEEPSDLENCIRTKWPGALIEIKDEKS